MANEYVTLQDFKDTVLPAGQSASYLDENISSALEAASRAVDKSCSKRGLRRFYQDDGGTDGDVERRFTAWDADTVEIFDTTSVTTVEIDTDGDGVFDVELVEDTDYLLMPLNAAEDGEPWTYLVMNDTSSYSWPSGTGSVKVTGLFGWVEAPPEVKEATTLIASRLLKRKREAPFGVVGFGSENVAAVHITRSDPDVKGLLQPYMRDRRAISHSLDS